MNALQEEIKLMKKAGAKLDDSLIHEWIAQGHHLTGGWERSMHGTVLNAANTTILIGTMAKYGVYINAGVSPDRIPFREGSGAGHSKYIDGLIMFWKLRGLGEKEATRAAFATAKVHKAEGMPSTGSYKYSQSGQRTLFISIVDKVISKDIDQLILNGLDAIVDRKYHETKSETI